MAEDSKVSRLIYILFVGILLAVFVGVGVNTFYPESSVQSYPPALNERGEIMHPYERNVSIITLSLSVLLLAAGVLFGKKIQIVADGITLGGLFTLLYSLMRSFDSQDSKYVFAVATAALIIVLYLGYKRFVK